MNIQLTEFLAIWGATIGTGNFCWNIWTWYQNRKPHLFVEVETREIADGIEIFYTVRNRGTQATTIEEIQLVDYQLGPVMGFGLPKHVEYVATCHPDLVKLPAVILPGGVWTGSSPIGGRTSRLIATGEANRRSLIETGRLFFKIRSSHFDRPIHGRVRTERLLPFG